MKSKFAKITDNTLGAVIVFGAVTAVLRYYVPLATAAVCAACITSCALFLANLHDRRRGKAEKLSASASDMFFDFMFKSTNTPAVLLCRALCEKGLAAVRHGDAVYCGKSAAFFRFDAPPSERDCARMIARAKHYGADRITVFCKTLPSATPQVDGFKFAAVGGDDTYKLFRSLGAMPAHAFSAKKKGKPLRLSGAFDKDKIVKYLLLSASLFAVSSFTGYSIITLVCACICALLFVISAVLAIVRYVKNRRQSPSA